MIRYSLTCANGHSFDSWFQSAEAFDTLLTRGMVSCVTCGCADVRKDLMAPGVVKPRKTPLSTPTTDTERKLAALRREVEKNSEYVGLRFAQEAREIHAGDAPHRSIHGEARPEEARALIEEGIPVAPLPFAPRRKTN
ncbi:hypothetical protein C8N32_11168 [Rhodovulum imhoffii]|uniref:DUF1178 family protein n=1 Tax=Rhodovulum imhoffii TaxID=365340 RepID=A0A2T5BR09_9RHOB|nr:DUF1178 family protein [Rhodovulum imhoffii]MBK5934980.1 hypothetical protein [Rhodovulum imhoffii]PTN01669.1 hypothetical protein C8N32_11168 [Rhodovulum imhoffii]